ncbi:MAG: GNAT family N-acetyltransferase [Candidatus Hodarchaeales archaeon]
MMRTLDNVSFRKAREEEISYLSKIINVSYQIIAKTLCRPPGALLDTTGKLYETYQKSGLFVIVNNTRLIGTFSLGELDENTVKLYFFAILPEYQKKGYGGKILLDIINVVPSIYPRAKYLYVEVYENVPYQLKFYTKYGFKRKGEMEIKNEVIIKLLRSL